MCNRVVDTCSSKYVVQTLLCDHSKESYEAVFFEVVVFLLSLFNFTILISLLSDTLCTSTPVLCCVCIRYYILFWRVNT